MSPQKPTLILNSVFPDPPLTDFLREESDFFRTHSLQAILRNHAEVFLSFEETSLGITVKIPRNLLLSERTNRRVTIFARCNEKFILFVCVVF